MENQQDFSVHGRVIARHIDVLLNDINLSELIPYLYAKKLITYEEWLSMPATSLDARSMTERVLGRLMGKNSTEKEFFAFLQCLKDSSGHLPHKELAEALGKPFLADEEEVNIYDVMREDIHKSHMPLHRNRNFLNTKRILLYSLSPSC